MITRLGFAVFFALNVMVFSMVLWSQDVYRMDERTVFATSAFELFQYLCLLFSLPVFLLLGGPLAENAWTDLHRGILTTDFLLLLGVGAAYVYSVVALWTEHGRMYFEVG